MWSPLRRRRRTRLRCASHEMGGCGEARAWGRARSYGACTVCGCEAFVLIIGSCVYWKEGGERERENCACLGKHVHAGREVLYISLSNIDLHDQLSRQAAHWTVPNQRRTHGAASRVAAREQWALGAQCIQADDTLIRGNCYRIAGRA